ncbi:hypothetical protein [Haloarchaeobius baliensis]|uniref:hypothetical protein n=1 Tax=Haloarchaeobius baliensis TaxID=1670458 RepID=UPI003F8840A8
MSRQEQFDRAKWHLAGVIVAFVVLVVVVVATGASVPVLGLDAPSTRFAAIGAFLAAVGGVYTVHAKIVTIWLTARTQGIDDLEAVEVTDEDVSQRRNGALLMFVGGLVVLLVGFL